MGIQQGFETNGTDFSGSRLHGSNLEPLMSRWVKFCRRGRTQRPHRHDSCPPTDVVASANRQSRANSGHRKPLMDCVKEVFQDNTARSTERPSSFRSPSGPPGAKNDTGTCALVPTNGRGPSCTSASCFPPTAPNCASAPFDTGSLLQNFRKLKSSE